MNVATDKGPEHPAVMTGGTCVISACRDLLQVLEHPGSLIPDLAEDHQTQQSHDGQDPQQDPQSGNVLPVREEGDDKQDEEDGEYRQQAAEGMVEHQDQQIQQQGNQSRDLQYAAALIQKSPGRGQNSHGQEVAIVISVKEDGAELLFHCKGWDGAGIAGDQRAHRHQVRSDQKAENQTGPQGIPLQFRRQKQIEEEQGEYVKDPQVPVGNTMDDLVIESVGHGGQDDPQEKKPEEEHIGMVQIQPGSLQAISPQQQNPEDDAAGRDGPVGQTEQGGIVDILLLHHAWNGDIHQQDQGRHNAQKQTRQYRQIIQPGNIISRLPGRPGSLFFLLVFCIRFLVFRAHIYAGLYHKKGAAVNAGGELDFFCDFPGNIVSAGL